MIFGNSVAKTKLVEQLTLVTLQTAHHGSTSPRIASPQRNHASQPVSTDFCNKIDPKRTSVRVGQRHRTQSADNLSDWRGDKTYSSENINRDKSSKFDRCFHLRDWS